MMDAEAIKALQESSKEPQVVEVDGVKRVYLPESGGAWTADPNVPYLPRAVEPLRVSTLGALVEIADLHANPPGGWCLHVPSHAEARLLAPIADGRRDVYAVAAAEPAYGDGAWRPGNFYGIEETLVALQTRFVPDAAQEDLISLLSRIKDDVVRAYDDSGVAQAVTIRSGAALASTAKVPSPVTLRPFRTFREADQPASPFIVRMKSGKDGAGPTIALFEADGGKWKVDAIEAVRSWLRGREARVQIIA